MAQKAQLGLVRVLINRDHFYPRQFLEVDKAARELRRLALLTPHWLLRDSLQEFKDTFAHQGRLEESAAIYGLRSPLMAPIAPAAAGLGGMEEDTAEQKKHVGEDTEV